MKIYNKMLRIIKKYPKIIVSITAIITCFLLILLYIFSYCIILPLTEDTPLISTYIYDLYIPVERLRFKSDIIWRLTEWLYDRCGGNVSPLERYNKDKDFILRALWFNTKGILIKKGEGNIKRHIVYYYNSEGKLIAKYKFGEYNEEGILWTPSYNTITIVEKGKILKTIIRNKKGKIIAECIYKDNKPWNGSKIDIMCSAIRTYKEGKQTKVKEFNLKKLCFTKEEDRGKGWPEIKNFSFPFKYGPGIYVDPKFYYEDAGRYK